MRISLIRHAVTAGNLRRAYIGRTDEPLCEEGIAAAAAFSGAAPACTLLAVSPLKRCRQTAALLYPGKEQLVIPDLRECDFGVFEGRNAEEMTGDPAFQGWIDTNGQGVFPGGEDPAAFCARCCRAFEVLVRQTAAEADLVIVAHGGTIMAVMERYALPERKFYEWHVGNVQGYRAQWDGMHLTTVERI